MRRGDCTSGYDVYYQYGRVPFIGGNCVPTPSDAPHTGPLRSEWRNVTHEIVCTSYTTNGFDANDLSKAVASVQADVTNRALTSYDILTDLAEAREIPSLVRSVSSDLYSILRSLNSRFKTSDMRTAAFISPKQLLKHPMRALRKLGSEWMAYRYGIMPLVYSYRDMLKTVKRGQEVTSKASAVVNPKPTGVTLPGSTSTYKWVEYVGSHVVSGTVYQYFPWGQGTAQLASLGFNPLVTAWELIPYSFVIDWFVNVGDYIAAKTSMPLSRMNWACISQRSNYTKKTWVHYPSETRYGYISNKLPTNWYGSSPPTPANRDVTNPEGSQLLTEEETQSYSRWLFNLGDARLQLNPSLNWRRLVDTAVMSLNQLRTINSFFKRR